MDSSQEYIDMSQKAFEIQERLFIRGDYYAEKILDRWYVDVFIGNAHYSIASDGRPMTNWAWLPRQDQLQEMAGFKQVGGYNVWRYCKKLAEYSDKDDKWLAMNASFEQLWMTFLMSEKFGKHWDGTTCTWSEKDTECTYNGTTYPARNKGALR